jgi:hypothetical protein
MRDALCQVPHGGLRPVMHRVVRAAWHRKALEPVGLPMSVVALDGKATALPCINGEFAQTHHPEQGLPYGIVRTMTCALVSAAAGRASTPSRSRPRPTRWATSRPPSRASPRHYGALFQMVTYDAGALSEANAIAVVKAGKDYLFALKNEHRPCSSSPRSCSTRTAWRLERWTSPRTPSR